MVKSYGITRKTWRVFPSTNKNLLTSHFIKFKCGISIHQPTLTLILEWPKKRRGENKKNVDKVGNHDNPHKLRWDDFYSKFTLIEHHTIEYIYLPRK